MLNRLINDFTLKEKVIILIKNYFIYFIVTYIYYNNLILSLIISLVSLTEYKNNKNKIISKRKQKFLNQFKEFLHCYLVSLSTGDNEQMALESSYNELKNIYSVNEQIIIYIQEIKKNFYMNSNLAKSFKIASDLTNIKEIINFAETYGICCKTGGNINLLIKNNLEIINSKISFKNKINELFAEKKLEMKIIGLMPIVMLVILKSTTPEYIKFFYNNFLGYAIITLALMLNYFAFKISNKMVRKYEEN